MLHLRLVFFVQRRGHADQLVVERGVGRLLGGQSAAEIFLHHGDRAADEVAQIVGKVGVDAVDEQLVGEIAVRAERKRAQQEEAQRVRAVALGQQIRIDDVALGFGHLAAVEQQPAVAEDLLGQRHTHAHEHGRPDDRVEADDLLADEMHVGRPVFFIVVVAVIHEAERRGIVEQRVDPDIDHVTRIEIDRNAPCEARARDAEILQTGIDEIVDHLIDAAARLEVIRLQQQLAHRLGIFRQSEEIGLLLSGLACAAAVGAFTVLELTLRPEGLARRAVHALIGALVNIAVFVHFLEDLLDRRDVIVIRGADEAVVGDVHQLPEIQHALFADDDVVDILLRGDPGGLRLVLDLLAVLVRSGQEHDVIAAQALIARHGVRRDGAIGVANVQPLGRVINRGRDKEFFFHIQASLSACEFYGSARPAARRRRRPPYPARRRRAVRCARARKAAASRR